MPKHNTQKHFASDNFSGVHPAILEAMQQANVGHVKAYGDDEYTERAVRAFRRHFGNSAAVYFVYNGTGANVLGLQAVTASFNAVICTDVSHINSDECGAPEAHTGCKLLAAAAPNGKLAPAQLQPYVQDFGNQHHVQPKIVSITQATELGTVYSVQEIQELADFAHTHNMLLHLDGARLANAAAYLGVSLRETTFDAGVDILSFGGTKNGMMFGEAVVFRDAAVAQHFPFIRKQGMQLASKMRFISAQFETLLADDLWLQNATHANNMAQRLEKAVSDIQGVTLTQQVQANGVFATLPRQYAASLQKEYYFYVWNEAASTDNTQLCEVRWMCSFDTTEDDIQQFAALIKKVVRKGEA